MSMNGGCHCGEVRYEVNGDAITHALCHCVDCRRHSGAPVVGWAMFPENQVKITKGKVKSYESSQQGRREFCPDCGTGLFYKNAEMLPNIVDIKTATLDDPNLLPARCHIQIAERISWMSDIGRLPEFERFPPQG